MPRHALVAVILPLLGLLSPAALAESPAASWGIIDGRMNESSVVLFVSSGSSKYHYRITNNGPEIVTVHFDATMVGLLPGNSIDGAAPKIMVTLGSPSLGKTGVIGSAYGTFLHLGDGGR